MKRRDFLRAAGGSTGAVALGSGVAVGQENSTETTGASGGTGTSTGTGTGTGTGTATGGGGGGGGPTKTVTVGPGGNLVFEPKNLKVTPGTTVKFVWDSDTHNIVVESQPKDANWEGTPGGASKVYNTGYEYSHTFQTLGTYKYYCDPHRSAGMVGSIEVVESLNKGGGKKKLHDYGVPLQAHWVGAATILMIFMSLVFTFYVLKYGESPNTGNTGGGE